MWNQDDGMALPGGSNKGHVSTSAGERKKKKKKKKAETLHDSGA